MSARMERFESPHGGGRQRSGRELPELRQALLESARLLHQNRPGEAIERLLPWYQSDPTDPDLAINLSGAYILQRKWERAARILRQAVQTHPGNAMLWTNLAAAELGALETAGPQQQEKAIAAWHKALEADAAAPNVHYHLALIYKHRGELNRAAAFFQRALEIDPNDRDARRWLDRIDAFAVEQEALQRRDGSSFAPPGAENATSN